MFLINLTVHSTWGQEALMPTTHWSIGVSAGDIFHHLFNGDEASRDYPAFMLEYGSGNNLLQGGFRIGYNRSDTDFEGFLDEEVNKQIAVSGQIALLHQFFSQNQWQIGVGVAYRGGYSREDIYTDSGFDRITNRRLQWNSGGGPLVDIRFFVHPRISLGTQAGIIYSYSQSELQELFTNFPDFDNTKARTIEHTLDILEPATIHFRFHF